MSKATEVFELRPFSEIFARFEKNFRRAGNYNTGPTSGLYLDMLEEGFRRDKPLVTSVQADGRDLVLQGHRRFQVATALHAIDPERFAKLPCLRLFGLTPEQEIAKMVDQFHIRNLDEFETYNVVKSLFLSGKNEAEIMRITGFKRGYAQRRVWVVKAPACVEVAWKEKIEGKAGAINLIDTTLNKVMKAFNEDLKANPRCGRNGGPKFKETWENLVTYGNPDGPVAEPKAKTRKELQSLALGIKEDLISNTLLYAAGEPNIDPSNLADIVGVLRLKAQQWDEYQTALEAKRGKKNAG